MKALIDRNQETSTNTESLNDNDSNLMREVLDHSRFCKEKVSKFHGRTDLLEKVYFKIRKFISHLNFLFIFQMQNYILEENNQPFVIYGESGCGKTAILAKLAYEVSIQYIYIKRFQI